MADAMSKKIPISQMPLKARDWYILLVGSMEQLIGASLSTIVGIMIPLIALLGSPHLSAADQGLMGASGLIGIAIGSVIFGSLMDRTGYLLWFRICPLLIAAGAAGVYFSTTVPFLLLFLFIIGLGVGGGYSLDAGYISEIVPAKWESFFVGLAKGTCSLGFFGGAAISYIIIKLYPEASIWPSLVIFIGALGIITFLMRLRWYQSPRWLMAQGKTEEAQKAAQDFLGPEAEILPESKKAADVSLTWREMFQGEALKKVMLSGVSWACEGLGVYGFGVFLPILVMALGLQDASLTGIPKILASVKTTAFINIFIGVGFGLGLAVINRLNILKLMGWTFIICAIMLGLLLAAYEMKWPVWMSFLAFVIFEVALNAGPHLVTYIVPARIYSIEERGAGTGIATLFGKLGAVLGVFFMPALLAWGGIQLVLWVSIIVQLTGAAITFIYGKSLKLI